MSLRSFGWDRQFTRSFAWHVVTLAVVTALSAAQSFGAVSFSGDVTLSSTTVIGNNGYGTFQIDGGSTHSSSTVQIGQQTSAVGFATVTGAGSQWNLTQSGAMDVGFSGIGRLDILQGGVVNMTQFGQFRIAVNNSSVGTVVVDGAGSLLQTNSSISLGSSTTTTGSALLRIANGAIVNSTSSGQLQISPLGRIELDGGLLRVGQLANSGTIIGSGELSIQATSPILSGRIEARAGDLLKINTLGLNLPNQGIIAAEGGEIEIGRMVNNVPTGPVGGEITLRDGIIRVGSPTASIPQLNNSAMLAAIGGENDFHGRIMNDGNGQIAVTNQSVMIFHDDVEANDGRITVFPGSRATFLEDLTLDEDAELLADIAGTDDDTGFGKIEVVGTLSVAGALTVTAAPSFTPAAGDTFALVKAGNVAEAPSLGDAPGLPATLSWLVESDEHNVVLSVVPALEGDYNANGTVDSADYVMWRETRNQGGFGLVADGNHDGTVDDADLGVWRANFGATVAAAGGALDTMAAVPEPCAAVLLLIAAVFAVGSRRGRMLQ